MKWILAALLLCIPLSQSILAQSKAFSFTPTVRKGYQFNGKGTKLLSSAKDSDGNVFTLVSATGPSITYSNDLSQNYQETIAKNQGTLVFALSKINVQQRVEWTNTLQSSGAAGVTFSQLKISPQGNIALTFTLSTKMQGPNRKTWDPVKKDALFLFLENSNGALIKDILISGSENESAPKVEFGAGGELFLHASSNSPQVKYLNESYPFNYPSSAVNKKIILALKPNYYSNWSRSIEPNTLSDLKVYKDNLAVMAFNFSSNFSIYKKNGFIEHFKIAENAPGRGLVFAFDKRGYRNWKQECWHDKNGCSFSALKVYPNGNIGVHGSFDKSVTFGNSGSINEIPLDKDENGGDYFSLSLDERGEREHQMVFNSKFTLSIGDKGDNHTLVDFNIKTEDLKHKIHYRSLDGASGVLPFAYEQSCKNHFILDQNLKLAYYEQGGMCFRGGHHWYRLAQGKIKTLSGGKSLRYMEIPYGEEKDNDEDIPGLAFKPKFFHGNSASASNAVLSYAIPPNAKEAIIYYPPKGMSQLEYLSNSLVQATLNSTYFRGFAVLVFTSEEDLASNLVTQYFTPLMEKEYFNEIGKWNIVGYEDRAVSLIEIYNKNNKDKSNEFLVAKSMALYYPEIQKSLTQSEKDRAALSSKMPASFVVTGKHDLEFRKRMRELQQTFLEYGTDFSHMHFDGAPLTKASFSAVNSYGEKKSTEIFKKMVEGNCLDKQDYLRIDPREAGFIDSCVQGGLPLTAQEETAAQAQRDFIQHMEVHYGLKGHTPFLDQEYFEFMGYIKENHVVPVKKQQGDLNSVLK